MNIVVHACSELQGITFLESEIAIRDITCRHNNNNKCFFFENVIIRSCE